MESGKGADCGRIPKEKRIRGGVMRRKALWAPESEEFYKMKRGRLRHPRKSRIERRLRMQGVGTWGYLGRPDAEGRRPNGMSTQRRIQNSDLHLVRPVPRTHPAHLVQSDILADVL